MPVSFQNCCVFPIFLTEYEHLLKLSCPNYRESKGGGRWFAFLLHSVSWGFGVLSFAGCYGLNVCVPSKFIYWNPDSWGDDMRKKRTQSGGQNSHEWDQCPYKRDPRGLPCPSTKWGHSKRMAIYESEGRFSPDTESADALILNLSSSRTVRNKFLWFKPPSVWHSVIAAWTNQDSS